MRVRGTGNTHQRDGGSLVACARSRARLSSDVGGAPPTTGIGDGSASAACAHAADAARSLFESIFTHRPTIDRYLEAPLLEDRVRYLAHCRDTGVSRRLLRRCAAIQMRLIVLLKLTDNKTVTVSQIEAAAATWSAPGLSRRLTTCGADSTKEQFVCHSLQWMRLLGWLDEPPQPPPHPYTAEVAEFTDWARADRGYSEASIEQFVVTANDFLSFVVEFASADSFASITASDVDRYFIAKAAHQSFARQTIAKRAYSLRTFFRFAEQRDYCRRGIADAIKAPRIFDGQSAIPRLSRTDALSLLETTESDRPVDIRDRAILMLLVVYGLRSIEVRRLQLDDIDWKKEKLYIRRAKSAKRDVLPLTTGPGNALVRYLREVRPARPDRTVFFTIFAPIQPLTQGGLGSIVRNRIRRLGIVAEKSGPHALRHATAQHLLDNGTSLKEIGDFLGHTTLASIGTYVRFDFDSLREVADFHLGDLA